MIEMMPSIRRANASDADFLAWAILAASRSHKARGWFDIALNGAEGICLDYLRRLTLTPALSWWHHSRFLVAEVDGAPVSALSTFRAADAYPLSQQAMTEAAQKLDWSDAEQRAIWQRGAYIFTCTLEAADDVWSIENIATLPSYRGRGIATELLERAIAEGRANGARDAQITFFIGNDAAERTYSKAGFKLKDEKRHPDFEAATGVPGLRRFTRTL